MSAVKSVILGEEQLEFDPSILFEGYSHDRGTERIGLGTHRNPADIEDDELFKDGIRNLVVEEKKRRRKWTAIFSFTESTQIFMESNVNNLVSLKNDYLN